MLRHGLSHGQGLGSRRTGRSPVQAARGRDAVVAGRMNGARRTPEAGVFLPAGVRTGWAGKGRRRDRCCRLMAGLPSASREALALAHDRPKAWLQLRTGAGIVIILYGKLAPVL